MSPPQERIPGGIGGGTGVPLDSHKFYWIPVHPPSLCRVPPNVSTKHSFLSAPLFLLRLSLRPAPKAFYINIVQESGKLTATSRAFRRLGSKMKMHPKKGILKI